MRSHFVLYTDTVLEKEVSAEHNETELSEVESNNLQSIKNSLKKILKPICELLNAQSTENRPELIQRSNFDPKSGTRSYYYGLKVSNGSTPDIFNGEHSRNRGIAEILIEVKEILDQIGKSEHESVTLTTDPGKANEPTFLYSANSTVLDIVFQYAEKGSRIAGLPIYVDSETVILPTLSDAKKRGSVVDLKKERIEGEVDGICDCSRSLILRTRRDGRNYNVTCQFDQGHRDQVAQHYVNNQPVSLIVHANRRPVQLEYSEPRSFTVAHVIHDNDGAADQMDLEEEWNLDSQD